MSDLDSSFPSHQPTFPSTHQSTFPPTHQSTRSSSHRSTRRDFLKTSGVLAGAALAGNLAVARSAHAQGSDVLRVGLIGCGGRGTGAASDALSADSNTRLVAMGDLFPEIVRKKRDLLKKISPDRVVVDDEHCFSGYDAFQKVIDSGVDVVVLGSVPHFRPRHLRAAVEAGKHVFCEKPVAVDAPGIRSVLESAKIAEQKGLSIVSGLCWRYHTAVREVMDRVAGGAIGQITRLQGLYLAGLVGRVTDRAPQMSEMEYQARNWWFFHWLSGDHNVEQHVHTLDKALWVMGDTPPIAAWGMGGRQVNTFGNRPKPGDTYDHFAVTYEFPGGVVYNAYCRQQDNSHREVSDLFSGTKGACRIESDKVALYDLAGKRTWRYRGPKANMYRLEHEALFKSIRSGKPINNGAYTAHSTMMAILGRMCAYTGQRITWEQAMNSQEKLAPSAYRLDAQPPTLPDAQGNYKIAVPGVTKFI
ncbi:MAG: Gfo/Idh/MocA family oxidoreductase [Pirellulales bacterium]|nr:Gfo/Idh/MocA family oxidoreductase [Pirellulales bacterium]